MKKWPAGYGKLVFDEVTSTLDEAARVSAEHPAPFWLMARRQTAARGRRGRPWIFPDGNFAGTLILRCNEPPGTLALRSFVMSLALYHALVEVTGCADTFALKWPNDVLLNSGKVAGILLESAGKGRQVGFISIGVGVNLVAAPSQGEIEEGALPAVSVKEETSTQYTPEEFLVILAHHYAVLEKQFQDYGFAPIRTGWLAHAARLGEPITARTGRDTLKGTFEDVDAQGHLVLRGPRGVQNIAAADVFF